jgi:hypothetical protein
MPKLANISDVREIALPSHSRDDGQLVVMEEGAQLPFAPLRVFTVSATQNSVRGRHAHKQCTQFLVSVHGIIAVECDDGKNKAAFLLDRGDKGLLVPASIWGTETYRTDGAVLVVLCDRRYEEADYVRDYDQFLTWRRS